MMEPRNPDLAQSRPVGCLSRFQIERYLAGELKGQETARVASHVELCDTCRGLVELLQGERAAFQARFPFEAFWTALKPRLEQAEASSWDCDAGAAVSREGSAGAAEGVAPVSREGSADLRTAQEGEARQRGEPLLLRWRRALVDVWSSLSAPSLGALAAAAALVLLVPILRHSELSDDIRMRSGVIEPGELEVFLLRDGNITVARSGGVFYEGDRLEFKVHPGSRRYLHLFSLDDHGRVTPFYPDGGGASMEIGPDGEQILPGSIRLDDFVGLERIFVVFSDEPIELETIEKTVEDVLEGETLPLPLERIDSLPVRGASQATFLMVKE